MKISRKQLYKIITESIVKVLNESNDSELTPKDLSKWSTVKKWLDNTDIKINNVWFVRREKANIEHANIAYMYNTESAVDNTDNNEETFNNSKYWEFQHDIIITVFKMTKHPKNEKGEPERLTFKMGLDITNDDVRTSIENTLIQGYIENDFEDIHFTNSVANFDNAITVEDQSDSDDFTLFVLKEFIKRHQRMR